MTLPCPECGKAMHPRSYRCLVCSRRTPAVDPTPEEISQLAHGIRWGLIEVHCRTPRTKPTRPLGGTVADNDAWERQWREVKGKEQQEECEVEE